MKKGFLKIIIIMAILLLIAGLVLIFFPIVSNFIGNLISHSLADDFDNGINSIQDGSFDDAYKLGLVDKEGYKIDENKNRISDFPYLFTADLDRLRKDSEAYNEMLKTEQCNLLVDTTSYMYPTINLENYGIFNDIYGYIEAPTIDMKLPIYLGANDANMSYGAAHLTYTSLPLGGENTNCALAGHTGYIGRIFFDNICNLSIGDTVKVHTYWETLDYKVSETMIVAPDESEEIYISYEKDKLTLVTCVNNNRGDFDRFLVICEASD